jgi:hypothetical protein
MAITTDLSEALRSVKRLRDNPRAESDIPVEMAKLIESSWFQIHKAADSNPQYAAYQTDTTT